MAQTLQERYDISANLHQITSRTVATSVQSLLAIIFHIQINQTEETLNKRISIAEEYQ
jgi:hypothetical protein